MKRNILILICCLSLINCKEKPSYNPFDDQFNIDESYFLIDKLDTIRDTCGYYGLEKKDAKFSVFYAFYLDELIGKGFSFNIDTIKIKKEYKYEILDSINSLNFNPRKLNLALKKFNFEFYKKINNQVLIINKSQNRIDTGYIYSKNSDYINFYRAISFSYEKKNQKKWN